MKHWKEGLFLLPAIGVVLAAVLGFRLNSPVFSKITYPEVKVSAVTEEDEKENTKKESTKRKKKSKDASEEKPLTVSTYQQTDNLKDGVYTGSGTGFGGNISVKVTIADSKMTKIDVTDCSKETPSYMQMAMAMVQRILSAQSPNVDTVSGATYSSNGIREAVIQALKKAAGKSDKEEKQESSNKKKKKDKNTTEVPEGQPANGTFSGSAVCEVFDYTIGLKVKFKDGKAVSISGLTVTGNEDEANVAYYQAAWKPMVKRILKSQNSDVDVVSGATYSSNAIIAAYLDAYKKAVKANNGTTTDDEDDNSNTQNSDNTQPSVMEDDSSQLPSGSVKDGTYTVSAACDPDEAQGFLSYMLTADVTFANGVLTSIGNFTSTDESNRSYYLKAANGNAKYPGVVTQLLEKQSASGISAVTGATCSSKTIRTLYLQALTLATGVTQQEPVEEDNSQVPSDNQPSENTTQSPPETTEEAAADASIKDGTYTVEVIVYPDEWEEFFEYTLTGDVTFAEGKLVSIENIILSDNSNLGYSNLAANGFGTKPGIISQLISKQNSNVDSISGATCSSKALVELYEAAVKMAKEGE